MKITAFTLDQAMGTLNTLIRQYPESSDEYKHLVDCLISS